MKASRLFIVLATVGISAVSSAQLASPATGASTARYATDAYPGFECEEENVKPERKEPRWFQFITGPNRESAKEQYAYCQELVGEGNWSKAAKQLDALVRNWPTSPEAWKAQLQYADILYDNLKDYEEAFAAYRYLLDFYSLQCDYAAIADKLHQVAGVLKIEGKEVMFVRFANTVDVRRAYEVCVLRAPGAKWVPEAMLTIADLRVDEGKPAEAVKVFENLRSIYPDSDEAKTAIAREADVRMSILRECEYNRARCRDTVDFMTLALKGCRPDAVEAIRGYRDEALAMIEEEAYRGAKFYDSKTRTQRSAVSAYEKFLESYPNSAHADEIRARLEVLKGGSK